MKYRNTLTVMRPVQENTRKYVISLEILNLELAKSRKMMVQLYETLQESGIVGKHIASGCTKTEERQK